MSHILRLFESATLLTSVREAVNLVARQSTQVSRSQLAHYYESWRYAMLESCPDLSAEDPDGTRPDNAWPRGLPDRYDRAVYTFEVNATLLGDGLMGLMAGRAAPLGLSVLDARQGLVYRPDGQVLGLDSSLRPAPPPAIPPATQANLLRSDDTDAMLGELRRELATRLAPFGFVPAPDARGRPARLERRVGRIDQVVLLTGFFSHQHVVLAHDYLLYSPEITAQWRPVAGDAYDASVKILAKYEGTKLDGFALTGGELCGPDAAAYGPYRFGNVRTKAQARAWLDGFARHVVEQAVPRLDRIDSPRALAECLHTQDQRERLFRRNDVKPPEQFGRLVLIHAFDPAHAAEWHEALFDHCGRSNFSHLGWQDVKGLLTRLITHLQSPAFDPSRLQGPSPAAGPAS